MHTEQVVHLPLEPARGVGERARLGSHGSPRRAPTRQLEPLPPRRRPTDVDDPERGRRRRGPRPGRAGSPWRAGSPTSSASRAGRPACVAGRCHAAASPERPPRGCRGTGERPGDEADHHGGDEGQRERAAADGPRRRAAAASCRSPGAGAEVIGTACRAIPANTTSSEQRAAPPSPSRGPLACPPTIATSVKNSANGGNPSRAAMPASERTATAGRRRAARARRRSRVPSAAQDPSGDDERARLGQAVAEHVEQHAPQRQRAARRRGQRHQAHVLDARVRQHPLEVALPQISSAPRPQRSKPRRRAAPRISAGAERRDRRPPGPAGWRRRRPTAAPPTSAPTPEPGAWLWASGEPAVHRRQAGLRGEAEHRQAGGHAHQGRIEPRAPPGSEPIHDSVGAPAVRVAA